LNGKTVDKCETVSMFGVCIDHNTGASSTKPDDHLLQH